VAPAPPAYVTALASGRLADRVRTAYRALKHCTLCPRRCGVNRIEGELGVCRTAKNAVVASHHAHFGEEAPLVGRSGSGTIFFSYCNLGCIFCQNDDISHAGAGQPVSSRKLAEMMLDLQQAGCHNINLVTPSHVVPQILAALELAAEHGLDIPLVYNTGGYDRPQTLQLLDGIVDIYMPDFKFWDPQVAEQAAGAGDYPDWARRAVIEMHRQVGDLVIDAKGLARRGLLLRHLVLPGGLAGTAPIMEFIAARISPNTYVNIMPQYRPCARAGEIAALAQPLDPQDYRQAVDTARRAGLTRLDRPRRTFVLQF